MQGFRDVRAFGIAFLTAAATIFTQILVHRIVSAKLLNNYAFLVISLTMLGFALSGVLLSRLLPFFLARRHDALNLCAALFAATLLGASHLFYRLDATWGLEYDRDQLLAGLLQKLPLALPLTVPFVFCGLILGVLLSDRSLPTPRVYAFDLAGSAAGAILVLPAITGLGVEHSLIAVSLAVVAGTAVLLPPTTTVRRVLVWTVATAVAATTAATDRIFDLHYPEKTALAAAKAHALGMKLEYAKWDPVSRVEVTRIPPPDPRTMRFPSLIGTNRRFHERFERMLLQNNYAFTYAVNYDGTRGSLEGIEETIYAAAYQASATPHPNVGIIGVGGGFDVLTALYFDAAKVTAIEINAATFSLLYREYADYFRHMVQDPRVKLVLDEGRHYLTNHADRYDVLQLSGVDSYSGTPGAAHVFSESYLYTAEAMDLYLSRLRDDGILNMMRLEHRTPREMLRALATAVAALRRAGVAHPLRHVITVTAVGGGFTAMLVKRTPFTEAEERSLAAWTATSPFFRVSASPSSPSSAGSIYKHFLQLDDPAKERAFIAAYPFDISPVTDDRPFFFRSSRWNHLFDDDPIFQGTAPVTELSLLALLLVIGVAALLCVYLPLRFFVSRRLTIAGTGRYGAFFAATGVGYLAIEVALLQKFGLFLGHPNYALSVVLASLLLATGIGSLFSRWIVGAAGGLRFVAYTVAALVFVGHFLVFPSLGAWLTLPFLARCAMTAAFVAPLGIALGTFLPTALDQVKTAGSAFAPWAWGVNGIFSVLAPVLAVAVSMTWGMSALLLGAVPVYLFAAFILPAGPDKGDTPVSAAPPATPA